jgi:hypothetical protein
MISSWFWYCSYFFPSINSWIISFNSLDNRTFKTFSTDCIYFWIENSYGKIDSEWKRNIINRRYNRKSLIPWSFHWITCSPQINFSIIFKNSIWETTCWCITTSNNINRILKRYSSEYKINLIIIRFQRVFLPVINKVTHKIESCCQ